MTEQISWARPRFHNSDDDDHDSGLCVMLGDLGEAEARREGFWQFLAAAFTLAWLSERPGAGTPPDVADQPANPVCFLIRHSIELALKIAEPGRGHDLLGRLKRVRQRAAAVGLALAPEFEELVADCARVDPEGMTFRYASEELSSTCCVDPERLRADLVILNDAVEKVIWPIVRS